MSQTKHPNIKNIQLQYCGYLNTPLLWINHERYQIKQLEHQGDINTAHFDVSALPNRLGKRVEYFVFQELYQDPAFTVLAENIQIQQDKQTLGELDALLLVKNRPVHLEIVYKFYLYDPTISGSELDGWIGPNRKDSLVQKLNKLKHKQFPLLYRPETCSYLEQYELKAQEMEQYALFKAQLFVPKSMKPRTFKAINTDCIAGTYIKMNALPSLSHCQFYLPDKLNWLLEPHHEVFWLTYAAFEKQVEIFISNKQSPLVWIQHSKAHVERSFIVWWS